MGNAGHSRDIKIINEAIKTGKQFKINDIEHPVSLFFKLRVNEEILANDKLTPYKAGGKTYYSHSAWSKLDNILIKINQMRIRYWYWEIIE